MNAKAFSRLKVGDRVTLAAARPIYQYRDRRPMPAGSVGVVGAVRVPAVVGRERFFVCVDFPDHAETLTSFSGEPFEIVPRVSAFAEELAP